MSRRAARITHDEVTRMVKAVRDLGLPIGRVVFNGTELSVVIGGDNGEIHETEARQETESLALIREPKL